MKTKTTLLKINSLISKWDSELAKSKSKAHYTKKDKYKDKIRKQYIDELSELLYNLYKSNKDTKDSNNSIKDNDILAMTGVDSGGKYNYYPIYDYDTCKNCCKFYDNEDFCRYECWSKHCIKNLR